MMSPTPLPTRRSPRRAWSRLAATALVAALVLGGLLLTVVSYGTRDRVTLAVDGEEHHFRTRAETVRDALAEARVTLLPRDAVWPPLDARVADGDTITVHRAAAVAIYVDGSLQQVRTQQANPLEVLSEHGLAVGEHDEVQVNGQRYRAATLAGGAWQEPLQTIQLTRSVAIKVIDGGDAQLLHTTEADVGRALASARLRLYLADRITPDLTTPIEPDMLVRIERSLPLTVIADGERLATRAIGPTVGDALAAIGLAPIGQDYTTPPLDTPLQAGMTVRVVRVDEEVVSKDEPIPFATIYRPDTNLPVTDNQVVQEGADGVRRRTVRVRYEDGQEISRTLESEWVAETPKPRLIHFGKHAR